MADQKQGINPSPQKVNPKGKYNEKKWVKLGKRELLNIDEVYAAIYNNTDISSIYDKNANMYERKNGPGGSGRPKKNKDERKEE